MPTPRLRIVADANIPQVQQAVGGLGTVTTLPGREITRASLKQADVLLVRSVTRVDGALVAGTPVRFVGTATAGTDHVDAAGLAALGVAFASAPGSNAASVVDWVLAGLLAVTASRGESLAGRTLGIVGVGAVGGRLAPRAQALGLEVIGCDPPRAAAGAARLVPLAEALQADIVTLHTPLTTPAESPWPTRGLVDRADALRPDAWLVNAARGALVTPEAALALAASRPVLLDVWPGEPSPDSELVEAAALATPHIAGYAWDGKLRGTEMLARALRQWHGGHTSDWRPEAPAPATVQAPPAGEADWLDAVARQVCDVRADDARFRAALAAASALAGTLPPVAGAEGDPRADAFARLRKDYPTRREMARVTVEGTVPERWRRAVRDGLGMALQTDDAVPGGRA